MGASVVAGDDKQPLPSNQFDRIMESTEDDDNVLQDYESILSTMRSLLRNQAVPESGGSPRTQWLAEQLVDPADRVLPVSGLRPAGVRRRQGGRRYVP